MKDEAMYEVMLPRCWSRPAISRLSLPSNRHCNNDTTHYDVAIQVFDGSCVLYTM